MELWKDRVQEQRGMQPPKSPIKSMFPPRSYGWETEMGVPRWQLDSQQLQSLFLHCTRLPSSPGSHLLSWPIIWALLGPWVLILCTVLQLKHHCVKNPSDLCNVNVSGLKFSKVRLATRGVTVVSYTWGGSCLSDHHNFQSLWELGIWA